MLQLEKINRRVLLVAITDFYCKKHRAYVDKPSEKCRLFGCKPDG
jgi:hypothetical protein